MWMYSWIGRRCFSVEPGTRVHPTKRNMGLPEAIYLSTVEWNYYNECMRGGYLIKTDYTHMYDGREKNTYHPLLYTETNCKKCPYYKEVL